MVSSDPVRLARVAGAVYAANIVSGALAAFWAMRHASAASQAANAVAAISYAIVTILLYWLMRPAGPRLSILAALVSLAGCLLSLMPVLGMGKPPLNPLVLFGFYCLLLGALVICSTFLPALLGILLGLGGLGWLSFAMPGAAHWMPYNMLPGILAETLFTLWLLVAAVDRERRALQATGRPSPGDKRPNRP